MRDYIICDAPQGSDQWLADRAGKATGSRARDVLAKVKSGEAATRANYRWQIVIERLTGRPQESGFVNDAMKWGTEQEPYARMAHETATGCMVQEAGFIYLPHLAYGCSLDGFVGKDGIVEYKCPNSKTHGEWLLAGELPSEHKPQILHNLLVTGREWCDFVSFDPRLPENLRLFIVRYQRDEKEIVAYANELEKFMLEVDALESQLRKRAA